MIKKLKGFLETLEEGSIILDVQGVGYGIHISNKTRDGLPKVGELVSLWIEHIFRQDAQQLCGFLDKREQESFQKLLAVPGVGAKVALQILSTLDTKDLMSAVTHQDKGLLTQADGVGAKLAGRILLELKNKEWKQLPEAAEFLMENLSFHDARDALVSLGYARVEASLVLQDIQQQDNQKTHQASDLVRLALKKLSSSKIGHHS